MIFFFAKLVKHLVLPRPPPPPSKTRLIMIFSFVENMGGILPLTVQEENQQARMVEDVTHSTELHKP